MWSEMPPLTILIVIVFVDAVRGQCNGSAQLLPFKGLDHRHYVYWPDYDTETQRRANCTWDFGLPSTPHTSQASISRIIMNCTSYYEFRINGKKLKLNSWDILTLDGKYERGYMSKIISTCRTARRGSPQNQVPKRIRITLRPIINAPAAGDNCPFNRIFFRIRQRFLLPCPEVTTTGRSTPLPTTESTTKAMALLTRRPSTVGVAMRSFPFKQSLPTLAGTATKMWDTTGKLDLPTTTNTIGTHLAGALGGGLVLIIIAGISLKVYRTFSRGKKRTTPQNHERQIPRRHQQPPVFNPGGYDNVPVSSTPRILASGESHQYDAVTEGYDYLRLAETPGYRTVRRNGSYIEVNPIRADTFCLKESPGYEKVNFPSDRSIQRTPSYVEVNPVGEMATGGLIQKHLYDPVAWETMSKTKLHS